MPAACVVLPAGLFPPGGPHAAMYFLWRTGAGWELLGLGRDPPPRALYAALADPATHARLTAVGAPFTWGAYLCYDPQRAEWTMRQPARPAPAAPAGARRAGPLPLDGLPAIRALIARLSLADKRRLAAELRAELRQAQRPGPPR